MARQGLHQHRKFLRLARILGGTYIARGILEMLWEPAYDAGDDLLGDAEDIAARCGWDADANVLTRSLLDCGLIDEFEDQPGRYRIHDLLDHVPDVVRKRMTREAERMSRGQSLSELRAAAGKKSAAVRAERKKQDLAATVQQAATNDVRLLEEMQQTVYTRPTNDATQSPAPAPAPAAEGPPPLAAAASPAEPHPDQLQEALEIWNALETRRSDAFGDAPKPEPPHACQTDLLKFSADHRGNVPWALETQAAWFDDPYARKLKPRGKTEVLLRESQYPNFRRAQPPDAPAPEPPALGPCSACGKESDSDFCGKPYCYACLATELPPSPWNPRPKSEPIAAPAVGGMT